MFTDMDGILNINKPSGMTSHDVVARVRRILKERRVGHTGTLDPLATGVLVLCVGKATRIAQYLEAGEKEYRAIMRLGITTDTLDAEGRVLETKTYVQPDQHIISFAMQGFTGAIMQQPPAYSALKVSGVPSYKLAREGKATPHEPRLVTIFAIKLIAYEDPLVTITVRCSKGVYIRTLCADLGSVLGMGAHLIGLARTRSGNFKAENAITLDVLDDMAARGTIGQALTPIDEALHDLPLISITESDASRVIHGNRIACENQVTANSEGIVRLHNPAGNLVALAQIVAGVLRPTLVFSSQT
jgi:tRNA pseudouridine55 synthase